MPKLLRDDSICVNCRRCDWIIHDFSSSQSAEISDEDFKKQRVIDSLEVMIMVCEAGAIDLEY